MKLYSTIIALAFATFGVAKAQTTINVAAAANVRDAMEQIKNIYMEQNPQIKLNMTYGASGTFFQQICNGARYDIFLSADQDYAIALYDKALAEGVVKDYACGKLALYSKSIEVEKIGLEALDDQRVRRVAIANPAVASYGTRTVEMLKDRELFDDLKSKIIYGDNIGTTAQYVFTSNAEIGFVALSQVIIPTSNNAGHYYIIPDEYYAPIIQSCVVVKQRGDRAAAQEFMGFFLSDKCADIWSKYGYKSPLELGKK